MLDAVQSDGRIVVVGRNRDWGHDNHAGARFTADRQVDGTFGVGHRREGRAGRPQRRGCTADGKIVVAGADTSDMVAMPLNRDGTLDDGPANDSRRPVRPVGGRVAIGVTPFWSDAA